MTHRLTSQLITLVAMMTGLGVVADQIQKTQTPVDMIIYRMGVEAFFSGDDVYGSSFPLSDTLSLPFLYPPFSAIALAPITLLPGLNDDWLGNIMIILSAALLLWCLLKILRTVTSWSSWDLWAAAALLWSVGLISNPVLVNGSFAQINVLLMALVVADLVPRKRYLPQGWLIGIAGAIKLTPLAMCLYFLLKKDFKSLTTSIASFSLAGACAAAIRWDATKQFLMSAVLDVPGNSTIGVDTTYSSNSSLRAMIDRFLVNQDSLATTIWIGAVLLTVLGGGWIMLQLLHKDFDTEAWLVNSIIMLLVSPISWVHHWVWMTLFIPVFAWRALQLRGTKDSTPRIFLWVLGVWSLITMYPPQWWFGDGRGADSLNWIQNIVVSAFVWFSIATFFLIGRLLTHSRSADLSENLEQVSPGQSPSNTGSLGSFKGSDTYSSEERHLPL